MSQASLCARGTAFAAREVSSDQKKRGERREKKTNRNYHDRFESFHDMIGHEKLDAKNFVLLEDASNKIEALDITAMSRFLDWKVTKLFKYQVAKRKYALVGLEDYEGFRSSSKRISLDGQLMPIKSRLLRVNEVPSIYLPGGSHKSEELEDLAVSSKTRLLTVKRILKTTNREGIEGAVESLAHFASMSEFGYKSRYFLLNQLEEFICTGVFNGYEIHPFGSSANLIGDNFSDLDLVFASREETTSSNNHRGGPPLVYQGTSQRIGNSRTQSALFVDMMGGLLTHFVPGTSNVNRIGRARVPIVRFYSDITGLDCDLSFSWEGKRGVDMANILFDYCKISPQIRKLMIFVKQWAKAQKLTTDVPGLCVSNFMLMMLIIHFGQTSKAIGLPSMKELGILSGTQRSPKVSKIAENLTFEELLHDFFMHIATFDWKHYGINVLEGKAEIKPQVSHLYIQNPLEKEHNCSRNVSKDELQRLRAASQSACVIISGADDYSLLDLFAPSTGEHISRRTARASIKNQGIDINQLLAD